MGIDYSIVQIHSEIGKMSFDSNCNGKSEKKIKLIADESSDENATEKQPVHFKSKMECIFVALFSSYHLWHKKTETISSHALSNPFAFVVLFLFCSVIHLVISFKTNVYAETQHLGFLFSLCSHNMSYRKTDMSTLHRHET